MNTPTDKMIDAALPWLANFQHMRANDKREAVREALRAALACPTDPVAKLNDGTAQGERIVVLLRGINEARQIWDPIWIERLSPEEIRGYVRRGVKCLESAITDCRFFAPHQITEAAAVLPQHSKESEDDGRPRTEAQVLQRDGARAHRGGEAPGSQEPLRVGDHGPRADGGVILGAGAQATAAGAAGLTLVRESIGGLEGINEYRTADGRLVVRTADEVGAGAGEQPSEGPRAMLDPNSDDAQGLAAPEGWWKGFHRGFADALGTVKFAAGMCDMEDDKFWEAISALANPTGAPFAWFVQDGPDQAYPGSGIRFEEPEAGMYAVVIPMFKHPFVGGEVPDEIDGDMPLAQAVHLAELWQAGKMIGGDAHSVCVALLAEIQRNRNVRPALAEVKRLQDQYRPDPAPHEWMAAWDAVDKAIAESEPPKASPKGDL